MRPDEYDKLANKLLPFILAKVRQASTVTPAPVNTDMSAAQIMAAVQSLDGPGSGLDADTVDGEHAAAFVLASTLDAQTILYATADNTPAALAVGASTIVGRKDTGNVVALTPTEGRTVLGLGTMAVEAANNYLALAQFADIQRQGFTNLTETSISFDGANTFTLTSVGATWTYYRAGIKYTISGNKTVNLVAPASAPALAGHYHIYIDASDGTLTASTVDWTLLDNKVPVASVWWNNALTPKYWMSDERHTALIDSRMQYYLHAVSGVGYVSGGAPTGTITVGADTNAGKTCGISEAILMDQDLRIVLAALSEPDGTATDYVVAYRTSSTAWAWKTSNMPFAYNAATNLIQWDNAGTMTDGTGGVGSNARWYNSYLLLTNLQGAARFLFIPGRGSYTTLALAQAESPASFDWTGLEIAEMVIAYRFTWARNSISYTSQGQCVLAAVPQRIGVAVTTAAGSAVGYDHNTLSNLQGGTTDEYYHLTSAQHALINAPTAPESGLLTVQGIVDGEAAWSGKAIFDTTNPAAIGTAAPGTQIVAARRDHVHGGALANLSDYATGTWTPSYTTRGSGTALSSVVYTEQIGIYTKIGRMVFITGTIRTRSLTRGTRPIVSLNDLPFTSATGETGNIMFSYVSGFTTHQPALAFVRGSGIVADLVYRTAANGVVSDFAAAYLTESGDDYGNFIIFSGFYQAAS